MPTTSLLRALGGELRFGRSRVAVGKCHAANHDEHQTDDLRGRDAANGPRVRPLEFDEEASYSVKDSPKQKEIAVLFLRPSNRDI